MQSGRPCIKECTMSLLRTQFHQEKFGVYSGSGWVTNRGSLMMFGMVYRSN